MAGSKSAIRGVQFLLAIIFAASLGLAANVARADPFATIYSFNSVKKDGKFLDPLTVDAEGNLYGVFAASKISDDAVDFCGGVFRLKKPVPPATAWTYTALYTIDQAPSSFFFECNPVPAAPVLRGRFLYGTTTYGPKPDLSNGIVFRLDLNGRIFSVQHQFDGTSGKTPNGLTLGPDGMLYGTTYYGGPNMGCAVGSGGDPSEGVLFRLRPSGEYEVLHAFGHGNSNPNGALVVGPDGALYGTTIRRCLGEKFGAGTVFRITTDGSYSVIHSFTHDEAAFNPKGRLVFGSDGTLYGTTSGDFNECRPYCNNHSGKEDDGTVWSLKPGAAGEPWTYKAIFKFESYSQGESPCGLVIDAAGNLYGTTSLSTGHSEGLYRLSPPTTGTKWRFKVLHHMYDATCDPIIVGNNLYGTTGSEYLSLTTVFSYDLTQAPK